MIKTLARHVRGYVRESVLTPLFMILEVIMETIIPWLMSVMIDEGVNKGNMQQIIITGLWMLLCALIALFAVLPVPVPEQAQALPRICARRCLKTSSPFPLPISTNTPPPVWSRV